MLLKKENFIGLDSRNRLKAEKKNVIQKNEQETIDKIVENRKKKELFTRIGCPENNEI